MIKAAGDAGNKCGRYKHRRKHQSYAHNRTGYLLHCFQRGSLWRQTFFDVAFDGFDDNNGIIDDKANGEHEAEKSTDAFAHRRGLHPS